MIIFLLVEERQKDEKSPNANTNTVRTNAILSTRHWVLDTVKNLLATATIARPAKKSISEMKH